MKSQQAPTKRALNHARQVGSLMGRKGMAEDLGRQLCAYIRHCLVATHGTDLERHVRAFLDVERNASREGAQEGAGPLQRRKEGGHYRIVSMGQAGQTGGWVAPGGRGERLAHPKPQAPRPQPLNPQP